MAKQSSGQPVRSAERMLDVLAAFTIDHPMLTAGELSQHLGLAPSTVRRLVRALTEHGFVLTDPVGHRYGPGGEVIRLASVAVRGQTLIGAARPVLERLARQTQASCELQVRDGDAGVVVDAAESSAMVKVSPRIGLVRPLPLCGAAGVVMAAWDPDVDRLRTVDLDDRFWGRFTSALGVARRSGTCIDDSRAEPDIWSVAAPLRDKAGLIIGAVQLSFVLSRAPSNRQRLVEVVLAAADEVSATLGGDRSR